jgi:hypothetical protein
MNVDAWVTDVPEGQPAEELVDPAVDDHESLVQLV